LKRCHKNPNIYKKERNHNNPEVTRLKKEETGTNKRNAETTIGVIQVWKISILVQKWND